ncbi:MULTISPECIES: hypothetical protein [Streptomyces]|uniref:Uncharacterized protein n=1 Tax=Streptomyces chartreusis NRRL 3882 TaxID=1079985 RepID=A0A2N9BHF0_STRCX|nr:MULTISPECIES: hypothetical protein [Streptomyces]MYS89232.1 hypothetical protein [Streptomyces sp. SID5464]SOR82795.1 hypothetical protein SCNRRL3882_6244 [Streptomyces chartreusis NRRL 3882]
MDVYEDHWTWTARPVRPQWQLALRFAGSVVWFPVVCALGLGVAAAFLVVGMFAEVITAFSSKLENRYLNAMGGALDRVGRLASWCVSWPELRHEGDSEYYKARVDKAVGKWTALASAPVEPHKPKPPVECAIPLRAYRGVGGWYVAEVALAQGWELRPTDVGKEVRLWWSAASSGA